MNEDDTFRILNRPNFSEIRDMYFAWKNSYSQSSYQNINFMKYYGWSWAEYARECYIRKISNCII